MTIDIVKPLGCSGCSSCSVLCPYQAITMQRDSQGFLYPVIDNDKCTNCGICLKVCPHNQERCNQPLKVYAAKHADKEDQISSTSGGFAAALSESIIDRKGTVYGVVLTDDFKIETHRASNKQELYAFKGSKYVQTNNLEIFRDVATDLRNGLSVAYFGSSCHVDGLQRYLNLLHIDTSRLVTVDFLCHGVPSPLIFEEYVKFVARKSGPPRTYYFRTPAEGWGFGSSTYSPALVYERRRVRRWKLTSCNSPLAKLWLSLFFSNNCLRPHCYNCPYAGHGRPADITMADYWGLQTAHPDFFDIDGVSLVITNTGKGQKTFQNLENLISIESTIELAGNKQGNLFRPSTKSVDYDKFWNDYHKYGFDYVVAHYTDYNPKGILKFQVKRLLRKIKR